MSVFSVLADVLMVGHSLAFPSAGALLSRNTPPERQGSTMGLLMASNAVGQHLYPSCGFEEVGRQVHYAMRL